ncbi:MAG: hypothetical protein QM500_02455 [Methylococcales bacterium]
MNKKSSSENKPRIPFEKDGIQVNFCKNPLCDNYGIPASSVIKPKYSRQQDSYYIVRAGRKPVARLHCKVCGEQFPIKSNLGIHEEVNRIGSYLNPAIEPSCPSESCSNHAVGISAGKLAYQSFGKTKSGSKRYKCKSCGKSFSVKNATTGQKSPHKNKLIFKLLMNKSPFRRICEVADVSMSTIYAKINFLHKQCLAFVAHRERQLINGKHIKRLYISVDRQEYVVNWSKRSDKRNIVLSAVGSADNSTGYVFQMNLNYDQNINPEKTDSHSKEINDCTEKHAYRQYARLWLDCDYKESLKYSITNKKISLSLNDKIEKTYNETIGRDDIEVSEIVDNRQALPQKGMQVHAEYTLYGHFLHLKKLFNGVEKLRFFLDQDSGIRAACLSAFQQKIMARTCDAFYVRLNKNLTVDEKRRVLRNSRESFSKAQKEHPELTKNEIKLLLIKKRIDSMPEIGKWKDKWLLHPFPNMSEPEKAVCYLTDYDDYDEEHQAWLYNKASMHGIDYFFMLVRRRLSLLERPISTSSGAWRRWFGYSAYNPDIIVKLLDIFRVYYNYCLTGQDKKTPAMRLGLAKGVVVPEDIIYF